jgi:hypothetical protein
MNKLQNKEEYDFNLDDLESQLTTDLETSFEDLEFLKYEELKIGDPASIGETMENVIWEQFQIEIGTNAGEDFIEDNNGVNFNPRKSAHIQTTENFAKGKIAKNNNEINYKERYDNQHAKFRKDKDKKIITYKDRAGNTKTAVNKEARNIFDKDRPTGSKEKGTDMDHTVSAAEIIRDPGVNAHMTQKEQVKFANSDENLNEMNASHNRSKSDKKMEEWLDKPNANGQKPNEIYDDLDKKKEKEYRKKDKESRKEFEKQKQEGENKSIEAGKRSRVKEVSKMAKHGLRAVLMDLLATLLKTIIKNIVKWFKSESKNFNTFIDHMKDAIIFFFEDFKSHLKQAGDTFATSVATAVLGPIVRTIKKAWMFLKQGWKSLKEAINYVRNPENKNKAFSEIMLNISKIIIGGLTVGGALVLGEAIEKVLTVAFPVLAIEIPLLGSIASILAIFLGSLIAGIIGALGLNMIDRFIAKGQKQLNQGKQTHKKSEIIQNQNHLIDVKIKTFEQKKKKLSNTVESRHKEAEKEIKNVATEIINNYKKSNSNKDDTFKDLFGEIDKIK